MIKKLIFIGVIIINTSLTSTTNFDYSYNNSPKCTIPTKIKINNHAYTLHAYNLNQINLKTCQRTKTTKLKDSHKILKFNKTTNNKINIIQQISPHYGTKILFNKNLEEINKEKVIDECYLINSTFSADTISALQQACNNNPQLQTIDKLIDKYNIETVKKTSVFTDNKIQLLFTGDAMLGQSIGNRIKKEENIFRNIEHTFKESDFTVVNLETSLSTGTAEPIPQKGWTFNAPIEATKLMKTSGIDITNLANNHTCDYGKKGLQSQMKNLEQAKILYYGAGDNIEKAFAPKIIKSKGIKIALLGFNAVETIYSNAQDNEPGSAFFHKKRTKNAIHTAKKDADIVIVSGHAGIEGQPYHNQYQEEYYQHFINSGADAVISHHPHVQQDYEKYKDKMIYYSLGNLVFETGNRKNYKNAYIAKVTINPNTKKITSIDLIDIFLKNGIPEIK